MNNKISRILLLLCITAYAVFAQSQELTTPSLSAVDVIVDDKLSTATVMGNDTAALEFLKRLEQKYEEVSTISGEFQQVKHSKLFLEEIHSKGVFYFKKPGKFRCDYLPPNESINIIVNDTAWLYVPEIKQVEKYYFGKSGSDVERLNQMLLGFGISVADVTEVYNVRILEHDPQKNTIAIKFILRDPENTDVNFESVSIWFDTRTLEVKKIYIDEVGQDETIIDIQKITLNKWISDSLFRPLFPQDVEIIEHF